MIILAVVMCFAALGAWAGLMLALQEAAMRETIREWERRQKEQAE